MSEIEPDRCLNCGAPIAEGWAVHVRDPLEGARLTDDHVCPDCGASFWHDDDLDNRLDAY
ncbi:MAG: hypothetical protein ACRDYF_16510 [Acidimicrobiia bacterium]